jgi:hypothetical protein
MLPSTWKCSFFISSFLWAMFGQLQAETPAAPTEGTWKTTIDAPGLSKVQLLIRPAQRGNSCGAARKVLATLTDPDAIHSGLAWARNYSGYLIPPNELHLIGEDKMRLDDTDAEAYPIRTVIFGQRHGNELQINVHTVARTHAGEILQDGWSGMRAFTRTVPVSREASQ